MRTILFVLVAVLTTSMYANFPFVNVVDFNGVYQDGIGQAKARSFQVKEYDFGDNPEFSVEKQGEHLYLSTSKGEFSFGDIPLISDNLKSLKWQGINASSNSVRVKLAIKNLVAQVTNNMIKAHNFSIDCTSPNESHEETLLSSCFNHKGHIAFNQIETTSNGKKTSIRDFAISVNKNRFSFKLRSSAKVKGSGDISFKDNKLVLKINKAKSSGFSVRKRFFKELKKIESANIKVSRPYITISI